ncbi:hypothetical protein HWV62_37968 [Athelia sp. TMB]|nr:hypothetical protein HWV62_37968 [Athelia sp. TMB]
MATATLPYGTSQPLALNLYAPQQTDAEYQALKRAYLGLLLPQQIIEICLVFEVHAPYHVRSSVWPMDLKSAVAALQQRRSAQPPPAAPDAASIDPTPIIQPAPSVPPPPENSAAESACSAPVEKSPEAAPVDKPPEAVPLTQTQTPSPTPLAPQPTAPPVPVTLHTPAPIPPPAPQPTYPHQPYGFSQPTASYPHVPYYGAATTSYNYPHSSYPSFPPGVSYSQHARKSPEPFPNLTSRQPTDKKVAPEDIPSYEEIIAEALTECADPEGAVPKNIFTFMAARYPLQSNFRPSASQALQKAYKRGRFEKGMTGKYKLNRSWQGQPAPRRARRPERQSTISTTAQPASSPFTRAPLENRRTTPSNTSVVGPMYTYPPPAAPPNPTFPPQDSSGAVVPHEDIGEGSDAWVAAQNILKAINFGSLMDLNVGNEEVVATGVHEAGEQQLTQPPPLQASSHESSSAGVEPVSPRAPPVELSPQDRAALQAQLALLAAQMAELAEDDGEEGLAQKLSSAMAGVPLTRVVDEDYDESDEDADMEMPSPTPLAATAISSNLFLPLSHAKLSSLSTAFRHAVHLKANLLHDEHGLGLFTPSVKVQLQDWVWSVLKGFEGGMAVLRLACAGGLLLGLGDLQVQRKVKSGTGRDHVEDEVVVALAEVMEMYEPGGGADWETAFQPAVEQGQVGGLHLAMISASQCMALVSASKLKALPLPASHAHPDIWK